MEGVLVGTEGSYDVVWPLGRSRVEQVFNNEMPDDLCDKTVAFIWDYLFRGDEMFSVIREHLSSAFPGVRYVDHEVFGHIHGLDEEAVTAALPARLRENNVDA